MMLLKKLAIILMAVLLVLLVFLLNRPSRINIADLYEASPVGTIIDLPSWQTSPVQPDGYDLIAENTFLALFLHPETTHFAVLDKRNDHVWHSNVNVIDPSASRTWRNMQKSTFSITYRQRDNTTRVWTNYEFAIQEKHFEIDVDAVDNGFKVTYHLADRQPKGYWFPTKISRMRYIQLVLNPFEEHTFATPAERQEYSNYLRNAYVQMEDDPDTYILALVTGENTAKDLAGVDVSYLYEIFYEIGHYGNVFDDDGNPTGEYHLDDVAYDNEMYEYYIELDNPEFYIPLMVTLEEDHLHTEIITSDIIVRAPYAIVSMRMLPYMGAASMDDEGYMVIPEGSGGLMHFNNGKQRQRSYQSHVYDRDTTIIPNRLDMQDEGARLPVFGLKHEQNAMLAIIEEGAGHAIIHAEVSRKNDVFNKTHAEFIFMDSGLYYLTQAGMLIWHPDVYEYHPRIRYYFSTDTEADYVGMARLYGRYLAARYELDWLEAVTRPLYLDILGSYDDPDYFLFFPYKNTHSLTTWQEAMDIIQTLEAAGLDEMVVNVIGWFNKGIDHEMPDRIRLDRVLGTRRDFQTFHQYLAVQGHHGYLNVDLIRLHDRPSFYGNQHISRIVGGTLAEYYPYDIASRLPDRSKKPYHLLKLNTVNTHLNRFLRDFDKLPADGLSLRHFGTQVYSDFHRGNSLYRYEAIGHIQDMLYLASEGQRIYLSNPNDYALPFVDHLADIPVETSRFLMVDEAIPFYQLAIAGRIPYAMPSVNLDQIYEPVWYLMRAIETGSSLKYTVTYRDSSLLINTKYNQYFATMFARVHEQMVDLQTTYASLPIEDAYLVGHMIVDEHRRLVTYSNGTSIMLDYQAMTWSVL
ncbi:MAG: hypothetical protein EA375_05365 [Acholeplasmataceae bacterium]|nr:MAG: hypothetical protein EA375_05365 [Acholeplasmataceae bacterium]